MPRTPDKRSKEAGDRFENARFIFASSYEKLVAVPRWEQIVKYFEVRDIRDWKKKGIPLKRLPELAKFFRVPQDWLDSPDISINIFKKAVILRKDNPEAELPGTPMRGIGEWESCELCGRSTGNMVSCCACNATRICMESCYDAGEEKCIKCSQTLSLENKHIKNFIEMKNPGSTFEAELWSDHAAERNRRTKRDFDAIVKKKYYHYKTGDKVKVWFKCSSDAYAYLFNIGPTGNIAMIIPNKFTGVNRVAKDEKIQFPDESQDWVLKKPIGQETIKLFVTKRKVELLDSWLKEVFELVFLKIPKRRIGVVTRAFSELPSEEWAEATTVLNQRKTDV